MSDKLLTGYPSIDKPWLKYYSEETINAPIPKCTVFESIYENNRHYHNSEKEKLVLTTQKMTGIPSENLSMYDQWLACNKSRFEIPGIEYFGKQFTFGETDKIIDQYAKAFMELGHKKDYSVTICAPIIPSTIFAFYALNKIGIRVNFVSHLLIQSNAIEYIDNNETETLVILDRFYLSCAEALNQTHLKNVIVSSLGDDTSAEMSQLLGGDAFVSMAKELSAASNFKVLSIPEFADLGKHSTADVVSSHEENMTAVILYTGGSTGVPKGVEITNEGMANMYKLYQAKEFDFVPGDRNLCIIPPNHPTSFVHCMITPFIYGVTQVLQPIYDKNRFASDLRDLNVQSVMAAASHYATLVKSDLAEGALSHIKWAFCGGEPVPYELAKTINQVLEKTGVQNPYLALGYGMSELGPMCMLSYKIPGLLNKVGQTIPGVKARIRDVITGEILGDNKRGRLEILTPCRMKGYFKNPELTEKFFMEDGYADTGDIAIRDEEGYYEVLGRANDSFITQDNSVVYLFDIENFVYQDEAVLEAEAVKCEMEENVFVPIVHIVLKPEYVGQEAEVIIRLSDKCKKALKEHEVPAGYKIRKQFETNIASGKRDYLSLPNDREDIYFVDKCKNLKKLF